MARPIRVRRENVLWLEVDSPRSLARRLRQSSPGSHRAYAVRLEEPGLTRHFVFSDREFEALWRRASESAFALSAVERLFLAQMPTPPARPAELPLVTAYEPDTQAVWLAPSTRSVGLPEPPAGYPALSEPPATETFTRTPHIELNAERPRPGEPFGLEVFCNRRPSGSDEDAVDVRVDLPKGWQKADLQVWLVTSSHFRAALSQGEVRLLRGEEESTRARFDLAVVESPPPGDGRVTAVFAYAGRPCGQVTRAVPLGSASDRRHEPRKPARDRPKPSVEVHPDARRADLTITVKSKDSSETKFSVRLTTSDADVEDPEPFDWTLEAAAPDIVADIMEDFEAEQTDQERISLLRGAGVSFWRAAPKQFRQFFWDLIDTGATLETIFVVTDDRAFPWELVVPRRHRDGGPEQREPLGMEFSIGRWVTDEMCSPPQVVHVLDSYVLAPRYGEGHELPHAAEEAKYVCDNLNGEPIDPGDFAQIEARFGERAVGLAHFACHGEITKGNSQRLCLAGGGKLRPEQILGMAKLSAALTEQRPFVFLNACKLGRTVPTLVGAGGFATEFAAAEASCVLAPLWSVDDAVAHDLAIAFYTALKEDREATPAAVLKGLRGRAYVEGGADSWAAYCFYGDPLTRVVLPGP